MVLYNKHHKKYDVCMDKKEKFYYLFILLSI